jgi:flotillin
LRAELERLRLEVEVFLPAEAKRLAAEADAKGRAAPVAESGKAAAEALRLVAREWQKAGADGRDLYVLQHLREFVQAAVWRVEQAEIGEFAVVDGGDGSTFTGAMASFPAAVSDVLKQTGMVFGVDMQKLLNGKDGAR